MGVLGTLLRKRRAGEARMAWNLPNLRGPDTLAVTSAGFSDGAAMPAVHASKWIGGKELSPPLRWDPPPEGTAELLVIMEDIDVPMSSPAVHALAAVAPGVSELGPGALSAKDPGAGVRVFRSSFKRGYLGPAPIKGHGPHRYVFQVFALAAPAVPDAAAARNAKPRALLAAVTGPVLGRGKLTGVYER